MREEIKRGEEGKRKGKEEKEIEKRRVSERAKVFVVIFMAKERNSRQEKEEESFGNGQQTTVTLRPRMQPKK